MKKALTIYVDDDANLRNYCATFICWNEAGQSSVTMQNKEIPIGIDALYLPWEVKNKEQDACFFAEADGLPNEKDWRR